MLPSIVKSYAIIAGMSEPKVARERSLTDQVMDFVRESTLNGSMVTGEWYSVYQISDQLGISRSPVREALLRLEEAGLVKFTRNRGFQIVETKPSDVAEIFALRLGIEPAAAFRAALLRTEEQLKEADSIIESMNQACTQGNEEDFFTHDRHFHRLIMTMGQSHRGADLVEKLRTHTRILGASTAGNKRSLIDILHEHEPILAAIKRGSAEIARASMREHIQVTGKLLLEQAVDKSEEGNAKEIWDHYTAGI